LREGKEKDPGRLGVTATTGRVDQARTSATWITEETSYAAMVAKGGVAGIVSIERLAQTIVYAIGVGVARQHPGVTVDAEVGARWRS
jgi:hypothetical protein